MKNILDALRLLDKHELLDSDEAEKLAVVLLSEQAKLTKLSPTLKVWWERRLAVEAARIALREHYQGKKSR